METSNYVLIGIIVLLNGYIAFLSRKLDTQKKETYHWRSMYLDSRKKQQ